MPRRAHACAEQPSLAALFVRAGWATSALYVPFVERSHFRAGEPDLDTIRRGVEREFEPLVADIAEARWAALGAGGSGSGGGGDDGFGRLGAACAARRREAHRSALAKLRPPPPQRSGAPALLAAGAAAGVACCLGGNAAALLSQAYAYSEGAPHVTAILPVLRGPLLLLAHIAWYGGAVALWSRIRISYAFIFGAAPGTEMLFAEVCPLSLAHALS